MEISKRILALARVYSRNADANGLPKIAHAIERFDRNCNLGFTAGVIAGFQRISDDAVFTADVRLHLSTFFVPVPPLPIHFPAPLHPNTHLSPLPLPLSSPLPP